MGGPRPEDVQVIVRHSIRRNKPEVADHEACKPDDGKKNGVRPPSRGLTGGGLPDCPSNGEHQKEGAERKRPVKRGTRRLIVWNPLEGIRPVHQRMVFSIDGNGGMVERRK